jgi:AcrR family transcriptional regulator
VTEAPIRTRRRQQPDETRTLILDTADRLLRELPFRELSVDDVMRPTGYGRTVFYRHFSGLPELVMAVLARILPAFAEASMAYTRTAAELATLERSREILGPFVAHWARHGTLMKAVRDAAVYDGHIDELVTAAELYQRNQIVEAMRQRQAAGFLQGIADPEQVAMALVAMTERYLLLAYGEPTSTVPEEAAVEALAHVWVAALAEPGREA